jgi:hypothetical protein
MLLSCGFHIETINEYLKTENDEWYSKMFR